MQRKWAFLAHTHTQTHTHFFGVFDRMCILSYLLLPVLFFFFFSLFPFLLSFSFVLSLHKYHITTLCDFSLYFEFLQPQQGVTNRVVNNDHMR